MHSIMVFSHTWWVTQVKEDPELQIQFTHLLKELLHRQGLTKQKGPWHKCHRPKAGSGESKRESSLAVAARSTQSTVRLLGKK
jgi:hypothetical protein